MPASRQVSQVAIVCSPLRVPCWDAMVLERGYVITVMWGHVGFGV